MTQTIHQTIDELHRVLRDYIEAAYHISAPPLIAQRKRLLDTPGVIHQIPYLESTPRYQSGCQFRDIDGLPQAALDIYSTLTQATPEHPRLLHDPPYKHQSDAIRSSLVDRNNLLVMTGTGSGKTEAFLLPILGKLAQEAQSRPASFSGRSAMRAMILYPMNALVNDQLGRLRSHLGDPRVVGQFQSWADRPARFARYTSRTPYAGVRSSKKDSKRLRAFETFYVDLLHRLDSADSDERAKAQRFINALKEKGKWPAKDDLAKWFGRKGAPWTDKHSGEFIRAVSMPSDAELLTRHEVQAAPPDLLVTNYSMLEYMLMRPIERTVFDSTRAWLAENPDETFLIVLDEAHLYRGAAGAEVGLLMRRLRDRLGISTDRMQVICATASFNEADYAPSFGAQLSGIPAETFRAITGDLALMQHASTGSNDDAEILSDVDITRFYESASDRERTDAIRALLEYLGTDVSGEPETDLYRGLSTFGPMARLVNMTMTHAQPVGQLGGLLFPESSDALAGRAVTALLALGSTARESASTPGLLPCRIHNFFRGLPGLWVCMNPVCNQILSDEQHGICGKMYSQPLERCACGSRVLELYTCRNCGTAYARAYTNDLDTPSVLWSEPGEQLSIGDNPSGALYPLDLLLEEPGNHEVAEPADYDLDTGRLNPASLGPRTRTVYIRSARLSGVEDEEEGSSPIEARGQFIPCAVCNKVGGFGRSYVQDHQTKGDQPFQALVARQLQIQPPNAVKATRFAPLRGRKVLTFSDSRQVAARLAPNIQKYSVRDSLRPMIAWGFRRLLSVQGLAQHLNLEDLYLAVLLGSKELGVRLRPELKSGETFSAEEKVQAAVDSGETEDDAALMALCMDLRSDKPPESLLADIVTTVQDRFNGLEALAVASIAGRRKHINEIEGLPDIAGVATEPATKSQLVTAWLRCWLMTRGFWLSGMPGAWQNRSREEGVSVRTRRGTTKFTAIDRILPDGATRRFFWRHWAPVLVQLFTEETAGGDRRLRGSELSLAFDGSWVQCRTCKSVHRPIGGTDKCIDCGSQAIVSLDPESDAVFLARKGFYRRPITEALATPPNPPMALIAAEHTAQLNSPQNEDVFSKAEENELLFQDIPLIGSHVRGRPTAIDLLSSTTTMEVGIDLGTLSGVALRNMPPGRANYQQRSGRAGRRGNAVATVVAFGSADSHDEHYFSEPDEMIRGNVIDPKLTLDNAEIVRRHIRAALLQAYHQDRITTVDPTQPHDLFSVLGTVTQFRKSDATLNREDFEDWLTEHYTELRERVANWIPNELADDSRVQLLDSMVTDCLQAVDDAIGSPGGGAAADGTAGDSDDEDVEEVPQPGDDLATQASHPEKLLDRLLYCGKLPRYAFPTDVASFHVFDVERSTPFRPVLRFAPSQGLPIALSQYAPGKQVWVSGTCYTSGAVYSPMQRDREQAWTSKQMYMECSDCGFARTFTPDQVSRDDVTDCEACCGEGTFGPARYWMRPPGFAHPIDAEERTSPDDIPETSYATRAKLTMSTPSDGAGWDEPNDRLRGLAVRKHLLVSNTGPRDEGYNYCLKCGRIEATNANSSEVVGPHPKPYPEEDSKQSCPGNAAARHVVLGTDFITDVALFSMRVAAPLKLTPGRYPTEVALRTVSESIAKAACRMLEIESDELMAEFRPALTPAGANGLEAEVFLYDTLPGGAGFSSQLADRSLELFQEALALLINCPEQCDASCYRCLRSFKNRFEHRLLDRHVGAELLSYITTGEQPQFNEDRLRASTELLYNDLQRQSEATLDVALDVPVETATGHQFVAPIAISDGTGVRKIIALSGGLTSGHPADPQVANAGREGTEIHVINELLVRGNLPAATREVYRQLTGTE